MLTLVRASGLAGGARSVASKLLEGASARAAAASTSSRQQDLAFTTSSVEEAMRTRLGLGENRGRPYSSKATDGGKDGKPQNTGNQEWRQWIETRLKGTPALQFRSCFPSLH